MAKDYTDFVLFIYDAGDRVYHLHHMRNTPQRQALNESRALVYDFHHFKYRVNMDRAYRFKWAPWKKTIKRPNYKVKVKEEWRFGTAKKGVFMRTPVMAIKVRKPVFALKVYVTLVEILRTKRIGVIFFQEPCTHRCSLCEHKDETPCPVPTVVEPMHISRIHQPSGEMRG